jgi:hypothetical protein
MLIADYPRPVNGGEGERERERESTICIYIFAVKIDPKIESRCSTTDQ